MISLETARQLVLDAVRTLDAESVDLDAALNRILAADVTTDMDMPPFHKAAMDGYACRREDLGRDLTVVETIAAGVPPRRPVGPGDCAKIMTGAAVPAGADCVVMVEHTEVPAAGVMRFTGQETADNICRQGEDLRAGDVVLERGCRIRPPHVALLATAGSTRPLVACRPRVAVIATGGELVPPAAMPAPGQIRNSNESQTVAQLRDLAVLPVPLGIAVDTEAAIGRVLQEAMATADVVLLSGGVSMGDFDLVPDVLRQHGFELHFEAIAIKPGKPTVFGQAGDTFCFGLPGNPVSSFVAFEILVKPFLLAMMGCCREPAMPSLALARSFRRRKTKREAWIPVRICAESGTVEAVEYHGSAHSYALCAADGLMRIPAGVAEVTEGSQVRVRPL